MKNELTMILKEAAGGDKAAHSKVFNVFYSEIKKLAVLRMKKESSGHTLGPTALVNEAYLRLININKIEWQDRKHFLGMAATIMRQVLIDHARSKVAKKRGGVDEKVCFDESIHVNECTDDNQLLALNDCLGILAKKDARKAKIVELKYFGGYSNEEISKILDISIATLKRDWTMAKSWLYKELTNQQTSEQL